MYRFKINNLVVNTIDGVKNIKPKRINILLGPNNAGKSRILKEMRDYMSGDNRNIKIVYRLENDYPKDIEEIDTSYNMTKKMSKDMWGNWVLRAYSNKPSENLDMNTSLENYYSRNLNSFGEDWKNTCNNAIKNEDYLMFFQYCGALFYQYLGTEERLTICKTQKNYGLDSNSTNYLSACKFKKKLLNELANNVKKLFGKDIYLDIYTFGERLGFRVGKDFGYVRDKGELDEEDVNKLFNESTLDEQGDGLKSYVSTFLSLHLSDMNVLLLDEPEAFLHPPLARQLGELIGETKDDNKQIFVSTHSVEVLKGILSKSQDVNIIRIAQPDVGKNVIKVIDKDVIKSILETPLLRVSRVLEGLFCEKVVITEGEADEIIYQELVEKLFPQSGLYFAHGQNKQTLVDIAWLYKKIGIQYEIITDFDVLRVPAEFYKFLQLMPIKENERQKIKSYSEKLRDIVNESVDIEGMKENEAEQCQKEKRDEVYHKRGISFFEDKIQRKIKSTLEIIGQYHIHILETGELETLLMPYGVSYKDKKYWITEAINRVVNLKEIDVKKDSVIYRLIESIVKS